MDDQNKPLVTDGVNREISWKCLVISHGSCSECHPKWRMSRPGQYTQLYRGKPPACTCLPFFQSSSWFKTRLFIAFDVDRSQLWIFYSDEPCILVLLSRHGWRWERIYSNVFVVKLCVLTELCIPPRISFFTMQQNDLWRLEGSLCDLKRVFLLCLSSVLTIQQCHSSITKGLISAINVTGFRQIEKSFGFLREWENSILKENLE